MSEYIVRMPSDMPYEIRAELNAWYVNSEPIVRCRDCMHYEEYSSEYWCAQHDIMTLKDMSDGFCSWGERRSESLAEFIEREGRKRDTND